MRRIDRKESLSGTTRLAGGFLDTTNAGNPRGGLPAFLKIDISESFSFHRYIYQIKTFTVSLFRFALF